MGSSAIPPRRRRLTTASATQKNRHDLIAIAEWIPGPAPTNAEINLTDGRAYETRYWRCRQCGQERNRRREFSEPCALDQDRRPVMDGGYSIDDPRTRRALSENMTVHFVEPGPLYRVDSESGHTYLVDVDAESCTCQDFEQRGAFCKHLRRVDLEIRAGHVPGPDGRLHR